MNNYISIYRDSHSQNSTTISNQIIQDKNLSYQARFLLVWLLSLELNGYTKIDINKISDLTGIPVSRTRSLVQELQDAGHIKLSRVRDGNRYGCYNWYIFETPIKEEDL